MQIHHAKSFKMRHITYLYFIYLSIQVTIFLSGTDVNIKHEIEIFQTFFKANTNNLSLTMPKEYISRKDLLFAICAKNNFIKNVI